MSFYNRKAKHFSSFSHDIALESKLRYFLSSLPQFHDKIDPMLESLERIAERLRQPPSISVEVDKIKEQITENKSVSVDLEKLQPSYETLRQRGEEMIARSEGADKDISAKGMVYIILSYLFDIVPFHFFFAVHVYLIKLLFYDVILQKRLRVLTIIGQ